MVRLLRKERILFGRGKDWRTVRAVQPAPVR